MADKKISQLTGASTPLAGTEVLPIVQSSTTKKVSVDNLTAGRDVSTRSLTASGVLKVTQNTNIPASTGTDAVFSGGYGSPITGRLFIGDGTGWSYYFSKRNSSVDTDLYQFADNGNMTFLTGNLVQGTAAKGVNFTANTPAAGMTSQLLNWYEEGTWTPTFGAGNNWTTDPTTIGAAYTRIGRQVTATIYCVDGICTAGALIAGLPFAANASHGFSGTGAASDTTLRLTCSTVTGSTSMSNIPANTLTGVYWQLTITYFV